MGATLSCVDRARWQVKEAESIFMEVEEEEYAKLVSKRRQDEFVEEDGDDLGYKDDGEEAWNRFGSLSGCNDLTLHQSGQRYNALVACASC